MIGCEDLGYLRVSCELFLIGVKIVVLKETIGYSSKEVFKTNTLNAIYELGWKNSHIDV